LAEERDVFDRWILKRMIVGFQVSHERLFSVFKEAQQAIRLKPIHFAIILATGRLIGKVKDFPVFQDVQRIVISLFNPIDELFDIL
jgi:hypothetical protein